MPYLLAASPIQGHVGPVSQVGAHLVAAGHDVTMLTGSRFRQTVETRGMRFEALDGRADFDDRDQDSYIPDRLRYSGLARAQYEIRSIFVDTIPDQARALSRVIDSTRPDAVLVDGAFAGALPLLSSESSRPPILALGVTPLSQSERGLAPYGTGLPPATNSLAALRYAAMDAVARRVLFAPTQRAARRAVTESGSTLRHFAMDASRAFDRFLQTGPAALEYPRRHLAPNTRFVGILPQQPSTGPLPEWWSDLDGEHPVAHITQGTIDNSDFSRLIRPTLEALANSDVLVIVSTGGRPLDSVGPLPSNARAAELLPYDLLLPKVDLMITNGGYGGVQAALAHGIPLVVAGDTEEKPEVAARVAFSGAGIDLRTGTPSTDSIRDAVGRVLRDPAFAAAAHRIASEASRHDALREIVDEVVNARPQR